MSFASSSAELERPVLDGVQTSMAYSTCRGYIPRTAMKTPRFNCRVTQLPGSSLLKNWTWHKTNFAVFHNSTLPLMLGVIQDFNLGRGKLVTRVSMKHGSPGGMPPMKIIDIFIFPEIKFWNQP